MDEGWIPNLPVQGHYGKAFYHIYSCCETRRLFVCFLYVARHLFSVNSEYAKKSYRYSAVKVWNEIPVAIRELPTISRFKKDLKEYLKS